MTCFWKGILNLLDAGEINRVLGTHFKDKPSAKRFVKALKGKNVPITHVPKLIWKGT